MPESPLYAYIEGARRRLVTLAGPGESTWREVVERGLGEAYATADYAGLARVVQFLVNLLEAQARVGDALNEVDAALRIAHAEPGPRSSLEALKAALLGMSGSPAAALELANDAEETAGAHLTGDARAKALALIETVRMTTLAGPSAGTERLYSELLSEKRPLDHLFVLSWHIAFQASRIDANSARPLIRSFRAMASRQQARFREAEAPVFERWLAIVSGTPLPFPEDSQIRAHPVANWRLACLEFWQSIAQRNWAGATINLQAIDRRRKRPGSDTGPLEPFEALFVAASRDGLPRRIQPPALTRMVITNLAAGITGAYATALGGTRDDALEWLDWTAKVRRRGIESCLEAPVSLQRVHGLLALRAGKAALARKHLDLAASSAGAGGHTVEAALAHLQAEELRTKLRSSKEESTRISATKRVAEMGIDPVPHLFAIHDAWDVGSAAAAKPLLTPRETDILRQMASGRSYKESAERLGIAWTTVRTLSHRVYEKLSVSNRVEAIEEGRRLKLL